GRDRGVAGVELYPDAERHVLGERDVPMLALRERNERPLGAANSERVAVGFDLRSDIAVAPSRERPRRTLGAANGQRTTVEFDIDIGGTVERAGLLVVRGGAELVPTHASGEARDPDCQHGSEQQTEGSRDQHAPE